jgi:NitT/TauT family transport system substrate-binding protein
MVANPVTNLGHTHLAVAEQQGYYKDAGVKVSYLNSDGTVAVVQAVATGGTEMGQADTLSLDAAVAKGVTNVKAVCSYVANNIYYVVVKSDSSISDVSQLKGKKIGLSSLATGVYYNARVTLQNAGIDPDSDVTFVTIASPAAQLDALNKGTVDALSIIDVSVGTFKNAGTELRVFQPTGPMAWQWNVVVANTDFIASHPDAVAGVCKAIQEAEVFVHANPAAALTVFKDWGGDSGGVPDDQAVNVIKARSDPGFKSYPDGDNQWGWINVDEMNNLADLYNELGLLDKKVDVSGYYTTELLPKMKFDEGAVEKQATDFSG